MKKLRILSLCLVFTLVFNSFSSAYALTQASDTILEFKDNSGVKVRVDYEINSKGDKIFKQYNDGELAYISTINYDNPDVVVEEEKTNEFFRRANSKSLNQKIYKIDDYVDERQINTMNSFAPMMRSSNYIGTVKFKTLSGFGGTKYYSTKTYETNSKSIQSQYKIGGYVGPIVTLIAILVGALAAPEIFVTKYINSLILGLGVTVVQGVITNLLSATLSAVKTTHDMKLVDRNYPSLVEYTKAYTYVINSEDSNHFREVYYEGCAPGNWKNNKFAHAVHLALYGTNDFTVAGWRK